LNAFESPPAIIFTTAYDEYAIEAFDARAVGYVLKPVRRERLHRALAQAARLSNSALSEVAKHSGISDRRKHICARAHGALKLIPVRNVYYFHADQKYVRVHHENGTDLIDDSLKHLEEEFGNEFVRIHRSALVAVRQIDSLKKTSDGQTLVTLRDALPDEDSSMLISRRHVANVRRRIKGQ
jgi:two-component system response regulator AlgR